VSKTFITGNDSVRAPRFDSTLLTDTLLSDSLNALADSLINRPIKYYDGKIITDLLDRNQWINNSEPVYHIEIERDFRGKEFMFYVICILVLLLGIFKTIFSKYFNDLFRVYFNTSLRQTQLTDQLLQAKLPSLLLNVFFVFSAGIYIWLLFSHYHPPDINTQFLLPLCIFTVAAVYVIKYILLKFTGWVTDIKSTTENYIFVIFLVNKILGIFLLPFVILLAFAPEEWLPFVTTISLLFIGLFFLSRYAKSYGLIEKRIQVNPFQFVLYIIGAEIVPLLILYKIATDYIV